jgi:hypothetical protein
MSRNIRDPRELPGFHGGQHFQIHYFLQSATSGSGKPFRTARILISLAIPFLVGRCGEFLDRRSEGFTRELHGVHERWLRLVGRWRVIAKRCSESLCGPGVARATHPQSAVSDSPTCRTNDAAPILEVVAPLRLLGHGLATLDRVRDFPILKPRLQQRIAALCGLGDLLLDELLNHAREIIRLLRAIPRNDFGGDGGFMLSHDFLASWGWHFS